MKVGNRFQIGHVRYSALILRNSVNDDASFVGYGDATTWKSVAHLQFTRSATFRFSSIGRISA